MRGRKAAMKLLVNQLQRSLAPGTELDTVLISHTDCQEDAETLARSLKSTIKMREVIIMLMGPVIGAHVGPGTLALFYEADMTREEYESK